MQNKILIIGLGNMGMSHLESFIKKKFIIDIVENKNNKKINDHKKRKTVGTLDGGNTKCGNDNCGCH